MTAETQDFSGLLARWGIPAGTDLTAWHGLNNQTFLVGPDLVLRISQNLTADQVRAEHRLLARLRAASLPFAVPEPTPALTGDTVIETAAGPATLTVRLPGARPDLTTALALERFGRAVGQLSRALAGVPPGDAPHDWVNSPHVHPDVPDVAELSHDLAAAGLSAELTGLLLNFRQGGWLSAAGADVPVQVVHGDVAGSNMLADERTGEITAILDFEIAGADLRIQDLVVSLRQSGALAAPDWQSAVAALVCGYRSAQELTNAEAAAVPDLLLARATGTVVWRAGRWRRGQSALADVADRLHELAATRDWLAAHCTQLRDLLRQSAGLGA
ncbi:MAG TPA: phosphotransferase [Streptosporangiaceae bacterium]